MGNPYIEKEVKKVLESKDYAFPLNQAMGAAWIIANFKGINIKVLDSSNTSSLCDYNIIATAENIIQARAMVDELQGNLKEKSEEPRSLEGMEDGEWILLDLGDVIVHIFQENTRDVFDLDGLWSNLDSVAIPQEFYFSSAEGSNKKEVSAENYF